MYRRVGYPVGRRIDGRGADNHVGGVAVSGRRPSVGVVGPTTRGQHIKHGGANDVIEFF